MNQADTLYRAFVDYLKQIDQSRECVQETKSIMRSNAELDKIEVVSTTCLIDEDWIVAIENGLIHIEKAIMEARQFIRTEGSVVPIEKVKRVSRDSVVHLSQHSDLITKEPAKGKNLIPDELYISERLSDFAVYENKFLLLLLNRLKSFVSIRYNKIIELTNEYNGAMNIHKTIASSKQKTVYELKLSQIRHDDYYLKERSRTEPLIKRMEDIQKVIQHLLNTELMQEVAKNPPLKPPIVKTNVLKMNRNFKGATELYDFILAYNKDGYTIKRKEEVICPFSDIVGKEIAQTVMLSSFLAYKHGLKLEGRLKNAFEAEERRRKQELEQKQIAELAMLKKRVTESGLDPFEYMRLLEKRIKSLEQDSFELMNVRAELAEAKELIVAQKEEIRSLNEQIGDLNAQILRLNEQIEEITASFNAKIAELIENHRRKIVELQLQHEDDLRSKLAEYNEQKRQMLLDFNQRVDALKEEHKQNIVDYIAEIATHNAKIKAIEDEFSLKRQQVEDEANAVKDEALRSVEEIGQINRQLSEQNAYLVERNTLLDGKILALKCVKGQMDDGVDYTKKESFKELEEQFNAFKSFFKDEWKKTKRKIRIDVLKTLSNPEPESESESESESNDT